MKCYSSRRKVTFGFRANTECQDKKHHQGIHNWQHNNNESCLFWPSEGLGMECETVFMRCYSQVPGC